MGPDMLLDAIQVDVERQLMAGSLPDGDRQHATRNCPSDSCPRNGSFRGATDARPAELDKLSALPVVRVSTLIWPADCYRSVVPRRYLPMKFVNHIALGFDRGSWEASGDQRRFDPRSVVLPDVLVPDCAQVAPRGV
jgi:hypothetical protein